MEIRIPLNVGGLANTYKELKSQLKQLELSVHHAQKAIESAEKEGVKISQNAFICYEYPALASSLELDKEKGEVITDPLSILDNYYDELQYPELRINLE
jgi:hypothetical protein